MHACSLSDASARVWPPGERGNLTSVIFTKRPGRQRHKNARRLQYITVIIITTIRYLLLLLLPGLWSRSRRLGLETVSRRTNVSSRSRLEKNCQRLGLVLVSAIYVLCQRPIIGQIVQATVRSVNGLQTL